MVDANTLGFKELFFVSDEMVCKRKVPESFYKRVELIE